MYCFAMEKKSCEKLFRKVKNIVCKLHNGELAFNGVDFVGFFGSKGVRESYQTVINSIGIHKLPITINVTKLSNIYYVVIKTGNMQTVKTYSF